MWHFPMVAVQKDAGRELRAFLTQLDALPTNGSKPKLEEVKSARHSVTYRAITLRPFRLQVAKLPRDSPAPKVVSLDRARLALESLPVSNLTRKIGQSAVSHTEEAVTLHSRR